MVRQWGFVRCDSIREHFLKITGFRRNPRHTRPRAGLTRKQALLWQLQAESDITMSHSPTNAAESPDDSQLDHTLQPSASATVERINLESLPDELLVEIIRNCENANANSVARSLCLVSKRMEPVARRELYHEITFVAFASLRILCRTLEENPQLGQYIVNLKLLVSSGRLQPTKALYLAPEAAFQLLWSLYFEVLKRSTGLRQVTMMLATNGGNIPTQSAYYRFIARISEAIMQSQHTGSTKAILPRLEHVRLTSDAYSRARWQLATVRSEIFKPFLHLPSMSTLEGVNDLGSWDYCDSPVLPRVTPTSGMQWSSSSPFLRIPLLCFSTAVNGSHPILSS